MLFEGASGKLGEVRGNGVYHVVLSDEGFADYIGVCEGGFGVCEEVVEGERFVLRDLEEGRSGMGEVGKSGNEGVRVIR